MQVDDDGILQRLFESLLPSAIEEILEQPLPVAGVRGVQVAGKERDEVFKSLEKSVVYIFVLSIFLNILILFVLSQLLYALHRGRFVVILYALHRGSFQCIQFVFICVRVFLLFLFNVVL